MVFETSSSDELAYAVDYQDNDLDRGWNRFRTFSSAEHAAVWAEALNALDTVSQAIVVAVPTRAFARVGA